MSLLIVQVTFNSPFQPKPSNDSGVPQVSNVKWWQKWMLSPYQWGTLGWGALTQNGTAYIPLIWQFCFVLWKNVPDGLLWAGKKTYHLYLSSWIRTGRQAKLQSLGVSERGISEHLRLQENIITGEQQHQTSWQQSAQVPYESLDRDVPAVLVAGADSCCQEVSALSMQEQ